MPRLRDALLRETDDGAESDPDAAGARFGTGNGNAGGGSS